MIRPHHHIGLEHIPRMLTHGPRESRNTVTKSHRYTRDRTRHEPNHDPVTDTAARPLEMSPPCPRSTTRGLIAYLLPWGSPWASVVAQRVRLL